MGVVFVIVGVILVGVGYALFADRATQDWWMAFDQRQRELFGSLMVPFRYTRERTRASGVWTMLLGVAFLIGGFSQFS